MRTILLLIGSNVFMTTAWYWHLKFPTTPLVKVILISWVLALFEYCMAVPANRVRPGFEKGHDPYLFRLRDLHRCSKACLDDQYLARYHPPIPENIKIVRSRKSASS